ncbi:MAG: hypothetical protein HYR60_18460 [Acidobacteria bacterium]|nr:hypothetical protein [Acidobacteriota bacterium]
MALVRVPGRVPAVVCSMYWNSVAPPQGCSRKLASLDRTCVLPSMGVKLPAWVRVVPTRAVNWKPQRRWTGSLTVTLIRCLTPGWYEVPPAAILTLPCPLFAVPA